MCELYTSRTLEDMKCKLTVASNELSISMNTLVDLHYVGFRDSEKTSKVAIQKNLVAVGLGLDDGSARGLERGWRANNLGRGKKLARIFAVKYEDLTTMAAVYFLNRINAIGKTIHDMHFDGVHLSLSRSNFYLSRFCSNSKSVAGTARAEPKPTFDLDQLIVIDAAGRISMIGGQP